MTEAALNARGQGYDHQTFIGAMNWWLNGVGEKITRPVERAVRGRGTVVVFSRLDGARMQGAHPH